MQEECKAAYLADQELGRLDGEVNYLEPDMLRALCHTSRFVRS